VVVNPSALSGQFQNAKLEQFKGKQIRAEGQISIYRGQKQLVVDSAEQLQMVE
jgi:DNA/RNA endonuclease YhcR with UshA esterase domain